MRTRTPRDIVEQIFRRLGFVFTLMGTDNFVDAVLLCCRDRNALNAVTKEVYPVIARREHTRLKNVEHNMRTARDNFWLRGNTELLNQMVGYRLTACPSVGELINYVVGYIKDTGVLDEYGPDELI